MERERHPIQLSAIRVAELFVKVRDPNIESAASLDLPFQFYVGASAFNEQTSQVTVGARGYIGVTDGEDEPESPIEIRVELFGVFDVDLGLFPRKHVDEWATTNAPLLLLPFLREHVYGLASRAGVRDLIVPMYIIPTVRVMASDQH